MRMAASCSPHLRPGARPSPPCPAQHLACPPLPPLHTPRGACLVAHATPAGGPDGPAGVPPAAAVDPTGSAGAPGPRRQGKGGAAKGGRGSGFGAGGRGAGGPRARGAAPSEISAAAQAEANALFTDPGPGPLATPRVGSVQVANLEGGRGRGLVASRALAAGELVLAVRPLALAWDDSVGAGAEGADAGGDAAAGGQALADAKFLELQRQLLARRYTTREAAWMQTLVGLPSPEGEGEGAQGAAARPQAPELSAGAAADGEPSLPLPDRLRDPDALADCVQANALEPDGGAEDEDAVWARLAAAAGAEAEAEVAESGSDTSAGALGPSGPRLGPVGLWPEAAMLNHSCSPNTVAYVIGDTLFVRASRKVSRGSELTVSYLPVGGGAEGNAAAAAAAAAGEDGEEGAGAGEGAWEATLLSPLEARRAALEDARGFVCRCGRCQAEEALDPKLRALMADISSATAALREDLENAMSLADADGSDGDDEDEAEEAGAAQSAPQRRGGAAGGAKGRRQAATDEDPEDEGEGEEDGEPGSWRQAVSSVISRAGLYLELMDAAMAKLRLTPAQQETAQSAVVPLYTVLWSAMGAKGEIEPRLAEVVAALVGGVAPGSADHLFWTVVARETAEILAAEEEALEGGAMVRGGGGFRRREDDRVLIADKACSAAFAARYGPISRQVYRSLLAARRDREEFEEEEGEEGEAVEALQA
ncbi:hypothetical protein HYH03_001339 [Edaphochlamys debaryana]|uniref:SET domain-containing protein n=1 Tax=Edaphochlamys debaryana TaxID=47281 RepID=A0A835YMU0_9CHLO|nr:hypothetical protein HYH03_001339 [Edaphochlamys debaryana]|eukprot:KAG2500569.1 hypothetical protein HYH03_001339 [Edaphochlamys debaryana]